MRSDQSMMQSLQNPESKVLNTPEIHRSMGLTGFTDVNDAKPAISAWDTLVKSEVVGDKTCEMHPMMEETESLTVS